MKSLKQELEKIKVILNSEEVIDNKETISLYTLNNLNYYGEELRILLLKNARRLTSYAPYPNNIWGYGLMCIEAALINMREIDDQSS